MFAEQERTERAPPSQPRQGQSPGSEAPSAPSRVLVEGPAPAPPSSASSPGTCARLSDSSLCSNGPPDAASLISLDPLPQGCFLGPRLCTAVNFPGLG